MVAWLELGATAFVSVVLALASAGMAYHMAVERRLTRIESALARDPLQEMAARLQTTEQDLAKMGIVKTLVARYGEDAVREMFERGARR